MKKILSIFFIFSFLLLVWCSKDDTSIEIQEDNSNQSYEASDDALTPEEVIENIDQEEWMDIVQWPIEVNIISPEEDVFSAGQARFYKAEFEWLEEWLRGSCNWKFYLKEYDEEVLYREMSGQWAKRCWFTSTFIDSAGDLRVHLDVDILDTNKEIIQTISVEKKFIVQ